MEKTSSTGTPAVVNAVALAKDESSDESSSEDDKESVEREKQLAALQQQVLGVLFYSSVVYNLVFCIVAHLLCF